MQKAKNYCLTLFPSRDVIIIEGWQPEKRNPKQLVIVYCKRYLGITMFFSHPVKYKFVPLRSLSTCTKMEVYGL